jgi:hypothetical protein
MIDYLLFLMPDCGYLIQQQLLRQKRRDEILQVLREMLPELLAGYGMTVDGWYDLFPNLPNGLPSRW